jgi:hypothetical protein
MCWMFGVLGFDFWQGLGIFLFTASRTALGPTQPIPWVLGALSLGVKRPGREADNSPPSSAVIKEWVELYFHSPNTPLWRGAWLKHWDNFAFAFYLYFYWRGAEFETSHIPLSWRFSRFSLVAPGKGWDTGIVHQNTRLPCSYTCFPIHPIMLCSVWLVSH